jgi:hypothetical protein
MERRFEWNALKPGHSEQAIVEVIRTSASAVLLVNSLVKKRFGF